MVKLGNDWDNIIGNEFEKEYYLKLRQFLKDEYARGPVYPDMYDLFSALKETPYSKVKVVILGQDPYHEVGQAHGMAFSKNITYCISVICNFRNVSPKNTFWERCKKRKCFVIKHLRF